MCQFEQEYNKWIKVILKSLKKNFQQLDIVQQNSLKSSKQQSQKFDWKNILKGKQLKKLFLKVNIQNQVSNQILQKFTKANKKKSKYFSWSWNSLIQSIQTSFQKIKFNIDLISITIIQDNLQQTKISKQLSEMILSLFFGVANFFVTTFKSKRSPHYYQKERKELVNAIQSVEQFLSRQQIQYNFMDQLQNQAKGDLILRSKLVQKIETLNQLGLKANAIKKIVQEKKTKIFQILNQQ